MTSRVVTVNELITIFSNLKGEVKKEIKFAMEEAVTISKERAKSLVDPSKPTIYSKHPYDTGAMMEAIDGGVKEDNESIDGFIMVEQPNNPKSSGKYYPPIPYYGIKGTTSEKYGKRMFLKDAVMLERGEIEKKFVQAIDKGLKEAVK